MRNLAFVNMLQSSVCITGVQDNCKKWKLGCNDSKFLACLLPRNENKSTENYAFKKNH